MSQTKISASQYSATWLDKGLNNQQIKAELLDMGIEERNIADMLKEISRMRHARNTTKGLYLILLGALLCLFSCISTLMSAQASAWVLYGCTSLGIMVIFAGMYKIFG